jgi:glycosyltransferase involved in cell wall biosynthesis
VTDSPFAPFEPLARQLGVLEAVEVRPVAFAEQPALLATAAVAVNPRIGSAGNAQKLLNYMAAGLPIVSFEGAAVPLRHEVSGLCVPDGDTTALAAAIERLLTDVALGRRLGDAARDQVRREFSWDQVAARVEGVYRDVLAGAGAR